MKTFFSPKTFNFKDRPVERMSELYLKARAAHGAFVGFGFNPYEVMQKMKLHRRGGKVFLYERETGLAFEFDPVKDSVKQRSEWPKKMLERFSQGVTVDLLARYQKEMESLACLLDGLEEAKIEGVWQQPGQC